MHNLVKAPSNYPSIRELDRKLFKLDWDSQAKNTKEAKHYDLRYWRSYLSAKGYVGFNEITEDTLCEFALDHAFGLPDDILDKMRSVVHKENAHYALTTIERRIYSLCAVLKAACMVEGNQWKNPLTHKVVDCIRNLRKHEHTIFAQAKHAPITRTVLLDMLETCKSSSLIDVRDAAILAVAWSTGGRRASEVCDMQYGDLFDDGDYLYVELGKSKTNQEGRSDPRIIRDRARQLLDDWLQKSGIENGPLFRAMNKYGHVSDRSLDRRSIRLIVKKRAEMAGYDPDKFTAHSIRRGYITEALRQNVQMFDVMALTGHRATSTVKRYYQESDLSNNRGSQLL